MLISKQTYSDLPFFITRNAFTNDLNVIRDLTVIRQSLKNIILTSNGERAFNYNFGGNIYNYLFENFTIDLRLELQTKIAMNIRLYEPRVNINDIVIQENLSDGGLDVKIDFGIKGTEVLDSLVVTLIRTR